jgi:1-acyl-sn-glycerol-3-phosphate acyltransferase
MLLARAITRLLSRLEVSGERGYDTSHGLILAVNHISNFDPAAITAACAKAGIAPRFMAQEALFTTPVIGAFMRACGHIRVDRDKPTASQALTDAHLALQEGSAVVIYPEGRIGCDPGLWPERGKTGTGRLALSTRALLIPVAIWGAHEVLPYTAPKGVWPFLWRNLRHRPTVKVRFGPPVDYADVDPSRPGAAQKVTDRLMDAIITELEPLRPTEPGLPNFQDPTKVSETRRTHRRRIPS